MLTKDLIRVRKINGRLFPQFVSPDDKRLLNSARELLELYEANVGAKACDIQEQATPLLQAAKDVKLYKGLNKILLDRCEFSHSSKRDFPAQRRLLFEKAAELLKSSSLDSEEMFRHQVLQQVDKQGLLAEETTDVYADLPECETLTKIKKTFPRELLERYNNALVQSLLLQTEKLELLIDEHEPVKMRNFFKYLKFFRLLASLEEKKSRKGTPQVAITIDGPSSLFENTQKYGLQLACFFPVICMLANWEMTCTVSLNNRSYKLKLDQENKLVTTYNRVSSYVPEEFLMFENYFKENGAGWDITDDISYINFGHQRMVFPDFSFRNQQNKVIHLELFHRWHTTQLLQRLAQTDDEADLPLIIGVDRFLYNKPEFKERLNNSAWFAENGFLFRDFPGVEKVTKLLNHKSNHASSKQTQLNLGL